MCPPPLVGIGLKQNYIEIRWPQDKINFHPVLNFALFIKRLSTRMPLLTSIALSGLFLSLPLCKRKPSTSRRVLSGGRTSRLSSALPMAPSTAKASTFSGAFRHGWRRSGRSVLQSSYGLRQHATVVGHPARFSSLSTWCPEEVFLPLQRLRSSHRPTFLDCLLSVLNFFKSLSLLFSQCLACRASYYSFSEFRTASFFQIFVLLELSHCSFFCFRVFHLDFFQKYESTN